MRRYSRRKTADGQSPNQSQSPTDDRPNANTHDEDRGGDDGEGEDGDSADDKTRHNTRWPTERRRYDRTLLEHANVLVSRHAVHEVAFDVTEVWRQNDLRHSDVTLPWRHSSWSWRHTSGQLIVTSHPVYGAPPNILLDTSSQQHMLALYIRYVKIHFFSY